MLAFTDLETTGLDHKTGSILEVGIVLTDDELRVVATFQQLVRPLPGYDHMDECVKEMHTRSGLLAEVRERGVRRYEAEEAACSFFDQYEVVKVTAVGRDVGFDLDWIHEHMPRLGARYERLVIDVSSFNLATKLWHPSVWRGRPNHEEHRALADALEDWSTMAYYRYNLISQRLPGL